MLKTRPALMYHGLKIGAFLHAQQKIQREGEQDVDQKAVHEYREGTGVAGAGDESGSAANQQVDGNDLSHDLPRWDVGWA